MTTINLYLYYITINEVASIQGPKKRVAKQVAPIAQPIVVQPVAAVQPAAAIQPLPPKPKRTLSEKQKETLQRGRDNLKAKKVQQLKDTQAYKDQMVELRAEQLKQH